MKSKKGTKKELSRRDFIKTTAIGVGATALAGLGASKAGAQEESSGIPTNWDAEADVVIVGFGGAGVAAAIAAHDAGATVLVVEKDAVPHGGNSGCSGGLMAIGNTPEGAIEYLRSMCWGTVPDDELIQTHALACFNLPRWIEQLGGKVVYSQRAGWPVYPLLPGAEAFAGPKSVAQIMRADGTAGDGYALFQFFKGVAAAKGISVEAGTVRCGTPAKGLIQNPRTKEILGVKVESGGWDKYIKANKAVILACGGYENNEEIRKNFAPHPHSAFITQYGTPLNTGDGIVMAQRVGAKLWHMNKKECHSFACVPASKELGTGRTVACYGSQIGATASIIVNRDGKRFMNEYFDSGHTDRHRAYDEFEHRHLPADDYEYSDYRNVPMFWIFDDTRMKGGRLGRTGQWVGIHNIYQWTVDNQAELAKGWFIKADTIEELGKKIVVKDFFGRVVGMNAAGLVETVRRYNNMCFNGEDLDFGRRPSTMIPLLTPPFYAMEICECQTNTQGGPARNKYNQTLDMDGKPIPRLYSVGELGSIYGFLYNGGGNVPEAYATGKIAGEHAASLEPWS